MNIDTQVYSNTNAINTKLSLSGGTLSGILNMGGFKLTSVATPASAQDAVNKAYVDSQITTSTTPLATTTTSGTIILAGALTGIATAPTLSANSVSSTTIVDGSIANVDIATGAVNNDKLDKTNIPLSGFAAAGADVDLGGFKLTSVATPASAQDAVNKAYVDSQITTSLTALETNTLAISTKLSLSGGTMSGTIDMNNNFISNLQTPTLDLQAANKGYVDTKGLLVIETFEVNGTIDPQTQLAVITPPNDVSLTITLPTSPPTGTQLRLKRTNDTSGTIQITGRIDGEESRTMNTAYQSFYLVYNGTQWLLIN